jgi:hypothetical protein
MEHTQYYAIQKNQSQLTAHLLDLLPPLRKFAKVPSKQENVSLR